VELVTYSEADLALTEAIECDPEMVRELGGPVDPAEIPALRRRRLEGIANGDWWFKIVPDPAGSPVGAIGIWPKSWQGAEVDEIGWMVLPEFQCRGHPSAALELILSRARAEPRFDRVLAFPAVSNAPSNTLCRRFGFTLIEERDFEFRGNTPRCNGARRLELAAWYELSWTAVPGEPHVVLVGMRTRT
jgi:RimJ/RimL family protein N-acetyltransferase